MREHLVHALLWLVVSAANHRLDQRPPLLIVVAYDGFRWDFMNPVLTPQLWNISQQGVWAKYGIKNQFPTMTAPTFYTIATGLYPESHGIMGNVVWDPKFNEFYDYFDFMHNATAARNSRDGKWYSGEPIWQTNERKEGHYSGIMRWIHGDSKINNKKPLRLYPFNGSSNLPQWKQDVDRMIDWFTDPKKPINLALFYVGDMDTVEHENSILSDKVFNVVRQLDHLSAYLLDRLDSAHLLNRTNVIFTSDHGHADVYKTGGVIDFRNHYNPSTMVGVDHGYFAKKGLKKEQLFKLVDSLRMKSPKFMAWSRNELPERYHFKDNRRAPDVIVVEYVGYMFLPPWINYNDLPPIFGEHGYLPENMEMRPFFMAIGPAFKSHTVITSEDLETVDLYGLMCRILGLENYAAPNNGTLERAQALLNHSKLLCSSLVTILLSALFSVAYFSMYCIAH